MFFIRYQLWPALVVVLTMPLYTACLIKDGVANTPLDSATTAAAAASASSASGDTVLTSDTFSSGLLVSTDAALGGRSLAYTSNPVGAAAGGFFSNIGVVYGGTLPSYLVVDTGYTSCTIEVEVDAYAGADLPGIAARYDDINNNLYIQYNPGPQSISIVRVQGGASVTIATSGLGYALAAGDTLRLVVTPTTLTAYIGSTEVISHATNYLSSETSMGLFATASVIGSIRYQNFKISSCR